MCKNVLGCQGVATFFVLFMFLFHFYVSFAPTIQTECILEKSCESVSVVLLRNFSTYLDQMISHVVLVITIQLVTHVPERRGFFCLHGLASPSDPEGRCGLQIRTYLCIV